MLQRLGRWHLVVVITVLAFVFVVLLWPTEVPPRPSVLEETPAVELRGLPDAFESRRTPFSAHFRGVSTDFQLMSLFVMPSDTVAIRLSGTGTQPVALQADSGSVAQLASDTWQWIAPSTAGLHLLRLEQEQTREQMILKAFVKQPLHPDSLSINDYRIGQYQRTPFRENPFYTFPSGFIEVTPELLDERVSPHFVLGQFVAKQVSSFPKYLLLDERLLIKLEMLLAIVNDTLTSTPGFHVMSGFRTPHYNQLIGNETSYSVHLYGGAADVFIDTDNDGYMDDLNGDGASDVNDARILAELVEAQVGEPWYSPLVGGLGVYAPAPHRGPFIHIDVRGEPARW